jgi:hypothetical protein
VRPKRDPRLEALRVHVHRLKDLDQGRCRVRSAISCTDPLRTVVDLGAVAEPAELDEVIERALAAGLVDVDGLLAEADRLGRRGRAGVGDLRRGLRRLGVTNNPHPSVLESRLLRVLARAGITPAGTEVITYTGAGVFYRLDMVIVPRLAVEVDGFRYHRSTKHKQSDERRRNRIRLSGTFLLVYTWWDVVHDPDRIVAEIRGAMAARVERPTA